MTTKKQHEKSTILLSLIISTWPTPRNIGPKKNLQRGGQITTFALKEEPVSDPEPGSKAEKLKHKYRINPAIEQLVFYLETVKTKIVITCENEQLLNELEENATLKRRVS